MRLVSTVVLLDDRMIERLAPLVDALADEVAPKLRSGSLAVAATLNGWTAESLAWGKAVAMLVELAELEGYDFASVEVVDELL
jgi:hypothetical protein